MSGVILIKDKKAEVSNLELITFIEDENSTKGAITFFELEKELLGQIFTQQKVKARSTLAGIQDVVQANTPGFTHKFVHYYLMILSSIVMRRLQEESVLNEKHALAFSATCIDLIETKLHANNVKEIGDELVEFYCYILKEKVKPSLSHDTVNQVIEYINENVERQLIVEEIAKRFNVSTSHLSRIFREYTSVTLVEYITIKKIEEVQYYLRFTNQKISGISERFQFCNQSYFTRVFKKYTGLTPGRFRKDLNGKYFQFTIKEDDSL